MRIEVIDEWLRKHNRNRAWLAGQVGCSEQTLIRNLKQQDLRTMKAVAHETGIPVETAHAQPKRAKEPATA